jgi:hypothetical protein
MPSRRCPSILPVLTKLFAKVWLEEIPSDWLLLQCSFLRSHPSSLTQLISGPIALTNTVGKIFFGVSLKEAKLSCLKTSSFQKIQKGFKPDTPGCLEHSFDAKFHQRQIVVSWLDLKNAYGL